MTISSDLFLYFVLRYFYVCLEFFMLLCNICASLVHACLSTVAFELASFSSFSTIMISTHANCASSKARLTNYMCMYVCIFIYVYIYTHTHMHDLITLQLCRFDSMPKQQRQDLLEYLESRLPAHTICQNAVNFMLSGR
jgi:hypothetical protein